MAWKEVKPMEQRISFVLEAERGRMPMSQLCVIYGISRKTGYKWLGRYQQHGLMGMQEMSRRPWHHPAQTAPDLERVILKHRKKHPTWGPKKLHATLVDKHPDLPSEATIGNILKRNGVSKHRRRRRRVADPHRNPYAMAAHPNEIWAVDFKGWFRTGDGERCDPLTISDLYSRFLLDCRITPQCIDPVQTAFKRVFRKHGLPQSILMDNGSPFGSRGVCGLTRLSVWWTRLGIQVSFIEPGHPEQNGSHERMHRTLKAETAKPPAASLKAQQRRFNRWRHEYNYIRPHESLGMNKPAQWYHSSAVPYPEQLPESEYPEIIQTRRVKRGGEIKYKNVFYYIGAALAGQTLGVEQITEKEHKIYFNNLFLGIIDEDHPGALRPPASKHQDNQG